MIENLEERRMFAVLVGAQLQVFGGAGNDNIKVSQFDVNTIRVEQNGVDRTVFDVQDGGLAVAGLVDRIA